MKNIDEARLENDLAYRFAYLTDFMQFDSADIDAIHAAAEVLGPRVPALVDAVYVKLFNYDATKRHFVPRQHGYDGDLAVDVESLSLTDEVIQFRKQHLGRIWPFSSRSLTTQTWCSIWTSSEASTPRLSAMPRSTCRSFR